MRCPFCNAWSMVLSTRGDRRRRKCGNEHRFTTKEKYEVDITDRNQQMVRAVLAGESITAVARQFGLKQHSELSRLIRKIDPERNNRSAGQLAVWKKRKVKNGTHAGRSAQDPRPQRRPEPAG